MSRTIRRAISILALLWILSPAAAWSQQRPSVAELTLGYSSQGRPITALRIGDGPRKLVLIGNTHGLPEANTFALVSQLADYYRANPEQVPSSVRLYVIPTINPDGLALGTRFNARGVDLNRNMNTDLDACPENNWSITVQGARGIISDTGGDYADSEVESRLVRDVLLDASAAIFYHSNAGNVFPAFCDHGPSIALAQVYADAGGYQYERYWQNYAITGGMHDWAAALGIAAIIPELISPVDPEFDQNLAAVRTVLSRAEELLPLPEDGSEQGVEVNALIWRYWRMHGGMARFGPPLAPPERVGALVRQPFANALLELHPDQSDTPYLVQPAALGRYVQPELGAAVAQVPDGAQYYPETGRNLYGAFAAYWQRGGGLAAFGYPLSDEYDGIAADGARRRIQIFERTVLAYYPEDGTVRPEPLGWAALVRERTSAPTLLHQIR